MTMETVGLYLIPFAGGSEYSYSFIKEILHPSIKAVFINFPGRGSRFGESLPCKIYEYVEDVFKQMDFKRYPKYAIFGHSMGGMIAYLLTDKIRSLKLTPPSRLIISSCSVPNYENRNEKIHNLPVNEFLKRLKELEGMPLEFFENSELIEIYEPILRNDIKCLEMYELDTWQKLNVHISALHGSLEPFKQQQISNWQLFTNKIIETRVLNGGHFYFFKDQKGFADEIFAIFCEKSRLL